MEKVDYSDYAILFIVFLFSYGLNLATSDRNIVLGIIGLSIQCIVFGINTKKKR